MTEQNTLPMPVPVREALEAAAKRVVLARKLADERKQIEAEVDDMHAANAQLGQQLAEIERQREDLRGRIARRTAEAEKRQVHEQCAWVDARRYRRMAETVADEEGIVLPPDPAQTSQPLPAIPAPEPQPTGPLPATEEPDGLLAQSAAMANPNGAATTQVDLPAGGDQPAEGPFPGGVESPAGPRPKRNRRRPQSDRMNEQDGDDR